DQDSVWSPPRVLRTRSGPTVIAPTGFPATYQRPGCSYTTKSVSWLEAAIAVARASGSPGCGGALCTEPSATGVVGRFIVLTVRFGVRWDRQAAVGGARVGTSHRIRRRTRGSAAVRRGGADVDVLEFRRVRGCHGRTPHAEAR